MDQNLNSQNNGNNHKASSQNHYGKAEGRHAGRDRRQINEKNAGPVQEDARNNMKQKGIERVNIEGKQQSRNARNAIYSGQNGRHRNSSKNAIHSEVLGKQSQARRIETLEDIKADIERIDKEIQFEIKQIKAVRLGL